MILGTEVEKIRVYRNGLWAREVEGRLAVMQVVNPMDEKQVSLICGSSKHNEP